jgi:hypothetical protein
MKNREREKNGEFYYKPGFIHIKDQKTKKTKNIKIHVYTGGVSSNPTFSFNCALQKAISKWSSYFLIRSTAMSTLDLRESRWSEKEFVDWLLDCEIDMIVAHPHQGTETFGWDVCKLYNEMSSLYKHIGFPYREQLMCPIFTQHKFGYLEPMGQFDMTNPSLKITVHKNCEVYYREWPIYNRNLRLNL